MKFQPPPRAEQMNRAHLGAYRKGWRAYFDGKMQHECPYQDKRGRRNMVSWSRSFIWAWNDGWTAAEEAACE